jgi:polysaccharide chain length determinant protein (PEP-CTERM system associated)
MNTFDLREYQYIVLRRKYWIIVPFLLTVLLGLGYLMLAPKAYEAETLILVQPQKVPEEYVRSIVSSSIEDRLRTISQQVTSRTNLEKIIHEFNLFKNDSKGLVIDDMVLSLRKRIQIDVSGGGRDRETSTFTISFRDENPETVMKVTNALASNFISENLKIREDQALGTSDFLADELQSVESQLLEKEKELKDYRERYMGGLPEQLETNLSILERLQQQLEQLHNNLRDAENRKITIRAQIAEQSVPRAGIVATSGSQGQEKTDIQSLRNQLASLEARYTDKHPDIIRLKETIASLEQGMVEAADTSSSDDGMSGFFVVDPALRRQSQEIELEIAALKDEVKGAQSQISWYEKKVEETPKREQELFSLNRDYDNLNELYNSLLNRKLEAEIAVSMEKKQKGEQFRVIDPAKVPIYPVEPDVKMIMILTLVFGLGLGGGLGYLAEMMDTSYKTPEEIEEDLQIPVLVSMPFLYTDKEQKVQKMRSTFKAVSVSAGFALLAICIVIGSKGANRTFEYVKAILENM